MVDPYDDGRPDTVPDPGPVYCPDCGALMVWQGDESVGWPYRLVCPVDDDGGH